jgi:alpha-tubulin suppressor-like RCC1 family protein
MPVEEPSYQDNDHAESEEANQEEMNYIGQMNQQQMQMDQEYEDDQMHYDELPQDPNIQEYQAMQQEEYEGDTKLHRTRGSGRSGTGNNGERARTPGSKFDMGNTRTLQNTIGHLKQIVCSKYHTLQLTRDGFVYSYGNADFSVSGHGGSKTTPQPQILKHLSDKRVVQIACGEGHSLILTDKNDVYSWGRGYEGQLGVSNTIEIASKPNYVKSFFNIPVIFIAAGAYYSLAITHDNNLYGWGEARMGQLGLGVKTRMVRTPTHISVRESNEAVSSKNVSTVSVKDENQRLDTEEAKIVYCSAGLGHTVAISEEGELFVWGFNNCGQLGVGDQTSRWEPVRVEKDIMGNILPQIQKAVCGYYSTYAIDIFGGIYSWGKGYIGHKSLTIEDLPRKIELNTENRIFTDVYCNKNVVGFYAPIRVYSISPKCGPAQGGTLMSIIGTGFVESENIRVRFSYGSVNQEVSCSFDFKTKTIYCKTPRFEEYEGEVHPSLKLPCE